MQGISSAGHTSQAPARCSLHRAQALEDSLYPRANSFIALQQPLR